MRVPSSDTTFFLHDQSDEDDASSGTPKSLSHTHVFVSGDGDPSQADRFF